MTRSSAAQKSTGAHALCMDPPVAPIWVDRALGLSAKSSAGSKFEEIRVESAETEELSFLRASIRGAGGFTDTEFGSAVERVYVRLAEELRRRARVPLRFWNYVPNIRASSRNGFSRYEVFNAGRFSGYRAWYGTDEFAPGLVASSGIGHRGEDFEIHLLGGVRAGTPLENPRQRPAYRYSRRYGDHPPCFARATVLEDPLGAEYGPRSVIVSGTASIIGEDSRHEGNLDEQVRETLGNLGRLSALVAGESRDSEDLPRALARYREIRAYVVHDEHLSEVHAMLERAFPNVTEIEVASVDLCRPELLFEAEGVMVCEG